MKWLDNLAIWWLSKRLRIPYGMWVIVQPGTESLVIEKVPVPGTSDPLQQLHTVALKIRKVGWIYD